MASGTKSNRFVNFRPTHEGLLFPMTTFFRLPWLIWMWIRWSGLRCFSYPPYSPGLVPSLLCLRHWNNAEEARSTCRMLGCKSGGRVWYCKIQLNYLKQSTIKIALNFRGQELSWTVWISSLSHNIFWFLEPVYLNWSSDGLDGQGSIPDKGKIFSSSHSPERLWGPPSPL
jgi:hypothetical protein